MERSEPLLYLEIAESIRRRIASGELKPGDKLPPVREMARRWSCTPGTVVRAYARLTQEGLVAGHRGGGTRVAPGALQPEPSAWRWAILVNRAEAYLLEALSSGHTPIQAESALAVAVARWRELQAPAPSPAPETAAPGALRFVGSHDLTIERLTGLLAEPTVGIPFDVVYAGSLGGLMALAHHEADVAGIHLWDAETDTYNVPFVRRVLPGRAMCLLTLAHRALGLIVPQGNPLGITSLSDLARPGLRWVNRQAGSGTRVWLDARLRTLGIAPETLVGYDREERTHLAVANAVENGEADAGLGIRAAADACGLAFVPLARERYDLVIPGEIRETPAVRALVSVIQSARFREIVQSLGGYDPDFTGQESRVL